MNQDTPAVSLLHAHRHVKASAEALDYYQILLQTLSAPSIQPPNNTQEGKAAREALMLWNGYYPLNIVTGAFFAIDTSLVVTPALHEPYLDVSLIISLDGVHASRFPFNGSFDGSTLTQIDTRSGFTISLLFTRLSGAYGPVANCSGLICLPGGQQTSVAGETYNNPILPSLFAGSYYVSIPSSVARQVLQIHANSQLRYDYGSGDGALKPVPAYVYNLNMYYFLFPQGQNYVHLIMGTSGNKGFACNDMCTGSETSIRSLLTIPDVATVTPNIFGNPDIDLVNFSGYYPLIYSNGPDECKPFGFVSIQAQYSTWLPGLQSDCYMVLISWSFDGVHSQGHYFDASSMQFSEGVLTMPEYNVTLKLTRSYDPATNALVRLEGQIGETRLAGYTPFNPVPLTAFGGLPLRNVQGDNLVIGTDNSVTYNGTFTNSVIYVPLMYILAYPAIAPEVVMSLGTDGTHGTACIVTTDVITDPQTTSVWSLPPA